MCLSLFFIPGILSWDRKPRWTPFTKSAYSSAPHVKILRIDHSLHFIMLDQPQAFSDAVAKFLKD
jgi:pimeloyl-ACP methyl ester carboxylesterase